MLNDRYSEQLGIEAAGDEAGTPGSPRLLEVVSEPLTQR